ncbi:amidase family protein [Lihuaxuella thermophila]|uniref:Amidase/aspartyl-tRNA(Asn)/glutamyl-tRNA(Gln) amidotransferase subunit A n=1 Tax=Lihuaxuella thermophila TaxID=1173111 RepID=A0A1H8G287_9BACL|nr:amidase family protein [Lihuaxuella thermophila]SEN38096.1 amidase/aspartyl-tRNA(Asn)/glutamyl-tRNA(Gln) amidotransferase subunit A [Lihuaxuella thermophila]
MTRTPWVQPDEIDKIIDHQLKDWNSDALRDKEWMIVNADIRQLSGFLDTGQITITEITALYLLRIKRWNAKMRMVISVNPHAVAEAKKLDASRKSVNHAGPLHGIPVLVKDNIHTRDEMATTAGTIAFKENFARQDAFIVEKLRDAGAIILAKANLSELGNFISFEIT